MSFFFFQRELRQIALFIQQGEAFAPVLSEGNDKTVCSRHKHAGRD